MSGRPDISRRDFLGGVALAPIETLADDAATGAYPPALMGMRGSHPGSLDLAHGVAWSGRRYARLRGQTDSVYPERFYDYYNQDFHANAGLGRGLYFSAARYGSDRVLPELDLYSGAAARARNAELLARYSLDAEARSACLELLSAPTDYLQSMPRESRIEGLRGMSYRDFLLTTVGVPESVYLLWRDAMRGWWGVDVRHNAPGDHVDVCYVRVERARARHVVMGCYNAILPHICPEMPTDQREAIAYAAKVPLVYMSIALRNWRPFAALGMHSLSVPQPGLMHSFGLDFPVSMGGYRFAEDPDQPTVLHGSFIPTLPDRGLTAREQHDAGRRQIYETTWEQFETGIIEQLDGALGSAGLDPVRDIAGLTLNRWPQGYAYEYSELFDPPGYDRDNGPHLLGARQMG